MDIFLINTIKGLIPAYDKDYEEKKKLKLNEIYRCEVRVPRNFEFHKKYFALINCAWEYQSEKKQEFFHNSVDAFRKTIEISAGWYEQVYSLDKKEWLQVPKSISFSSMDNAQFQEHYERVKDVLFKVFLKNIPEKEFMKNLVNF